MTGSAGAKRPRAPTFGGISVFVVLVTALGILISRFRAAPLPVAG